MEGDIMVRFNRRDFLKAVAAAGASQAGLRQVSAARSAAPSWPIGCFNRPWAEWSFDEALDGIKAAGYKVTGLLTRTRTEPFIGAAATPEYLDGLKEKIARRGLSANMGALGTRHNIPFEESLADARKQADNAARLGLQYLLSFGVDRPEQYDHYYRVMAGLAAYAQDRGLKLVMKPHGGGSGASEEILRCIEKVNHPNFKIWYDAGNIIHYTGKDPIAELEPIVQHVTGFCAKDCGQQRGDVMIQFGTGKVDFAGVFRKLKAAGFNGPIMVEGCALSKSPDEVTANARANREFLEKTLSSL
jgi:sugar phosphate isomerase/epimerase